MSKAPVIGQVKTRLIPLLGDQAAAELHRQLLQDTLQRLAFADLCGVEICCAPDTGHEFFRECAERYAVTLSTQQGKDLGERMSHAISQGLQASRAVVLVGIDCPTLSATDVDDALRRLAGGTDVVLGPAHDGGYYLVAMATHYPGLFAGIPWGGPDVLRATLQRAADNGLSTDLLVRRHDVDTPSDYRRWRGIRD